jgi:hypothetical protein
VAVVSAGVLLAGAGARPAVPGEVPGAHAGRVRAGKLAGFEDVRAFESWVGRLQAKDWVVYAKASLGGPAVVLKYLARYTHRVAIGNSRLVTFDGARVRFKYKDYADAAKSKEMTLEGVEFLRRWVQHVLPRGFVKIRHYGLLANRHRAAKLAACRRVLWASGRVPVARVPEPDVRPDPCPVCGAAGWLIGERFGPIGVGGVRCGPAVRADSS